MNKEEAAAAVQVWMEQARRYLASCGIPAEEIDLIVREAADAAQEPD